MKLFFLRVQFIIFLLVLLNAKTIFPVTSKYLKVVRYRRYRKYKWWNKRKTVWIGKAETYGAPTINLIIDFVNDCHYRMRFYYYMGVGKKDVIFGYFRILDRNRLLLRDGQGNKVILFRKGWVLRGNDNGYRIYLRRIR